MKENKLLKGFAESQPDYRPAAMWFWDDELQEKEITAQLEAFKEKGLNDFFVNHVWGATDEYLGDRYFDIIKYTVEETKRLGLSFWIYDEFNWPSGIAGGQLIRDYPELRAKALKENVFALAPMKRIEEQYINGDFESALMLYPGSDKPAVDISDKVTVEKAKKGFYVSYENNTPGTVIVYVMSVELQDTILAASQWGKYSFEQRGYVDPLDKKAMRAFIDSTHERYKAVVGDEFGKTVKGIFTDEVCVGSPFDIGSGRVPWNDELKNTFKARYGYDLAPWLYVLTGKTRTPQEKMVRYHYWWLLTELVRDAHIKQVYEWCDDENLIYTGHFDGEESLVWSMYQSGDIFELMKWMHVPGIDSIFSRVKIDDESFNVAGKIVGSCAKFYDRDRTLCETYTGSSTMLRFDEMQRVANRLLTLGANMIQYMGAYYSMDGIRKGYPFCYPPSHSYNNTMWEQYGRFGDYVSRMQWLSANTKPAGKVLVMWPQAGVYTNFDASLDIFAAYYDMKNNPCGKYDLTMIGLVNALLELNVEYDLFGDSMANDVKVENGAINFYGKEYDTVVIPYSGDTTRGVMEMVKRLKAAGIKMVFVKELPAVAVDEGCEEAPLGVAPAKEGLSVIADNVSFIDLPVEKFTRGNNDLFKSLLLTAVGEDRRTLDIRHNGDIYTGLRQGENAKVVFICNDANEERTVSVEYNEGMKLLDPETGAAKKFNVKGGRAEIIFAPHQMFVIMLADEAVEVEEDDSAVGGVIAEALPCCDITAEKGNVLAASWKFAPYNYNDEAITVPEDMIAIPNFDIPDEYAASNSVGLQVFDFEMQTLPEDVMLYIEYGDVLRCELNGQRIDDKWSECRLWGPKDACIEVGAMLKEGANRLAMVFKTPDDNLPYKTPFAMFRGAFEVEGSTVYAKRKAYTAAPLNKQGYDRFCGEITYTFKVNLTAEEAQQAAFCTVATREAAEMFVNGKSAGVRLWAPNRYKTECMFKAGENEIAVKATIPMWNIFRGTNEEMIDVGITGAPVIEKKA